MTDKPPSGATDESKTTDSAASKTTAVFSETGYADDPPDGVRIWVEEALSAAELGGPGLRPWVPTGDFQSSSLVRLPRFPSSIDGAVQRDLALSGVRNEQQSAQLAVTTTGDTLSALSCTVGELVGETDAIPATNVTTRFVGYVPVERAMSEKTWSATLEGVDGGSVSGTRRPDLVGEPLLEQATVDVPPYQTQPIWFTVEIPADVDPGDYSGTVTVDADGHDPAAFDLNVTVQEPVLPPTSAFDFHLDLWLSPDAIAREHDVEAWSGAHWDVLEQYFADLSTRSQVAVTATLVEHPWDHDWLEGTRRTTTASGYRSMVDWEYDGESWSFDFSVFDRYVETARACGIGPRIHAFGLLGFRPPEFLKYEHTGSGERVKERVEVGDDRWTTAWTAFFEAFVPHLREQGWLEDTWLAIDERDEDVLEEVVAFLETVTPNLADKLSIAGSVDADPYADDLSLNTLHVPTIPAKYEKSHIDESEMDGRPDLENITPAAVDERRREGKTTTYYVAGTPSHPNRLAFSPAVESRLLPWVAADNDLDGLLSWSYTSWPENVYQNPTFQYVQGDEYLVYPGVDGPVSSIRWELLREGIEDFELLAAAGNASDEADGRLAEALAVATADLDGREADPTALTRARVLLVQALSGDR